jgi:hypothetical protein
MNGSRGILVRVALAALMGAGILAAGSAGPASADLSRKAYLGVSPAGGPAGTMVLLEGRRFVPNLRVTILMIDAKGVGQVLYAEAGSNGAFKTWARIDVRAGGGAVLIIGRSGAGRAMGRTQFMVTGPAVKNPPSSANGKSAIGHKPSRASGSSYVGHKPSESNGSSYVGHKPTSRNGKSAVGRTPKMTSGRAALGTPSASNGKSAVGRTLKMTSGRSALGTPSASNGKSAVGHNLPPIKRKSAVGRTPSASNGKSAVGHSLPPIQRTSAVAAHSRIG